MKKSEKILPVILMVWPYVFSIFLFLPDKTGEAHINLHSAAFQLAAQIVMKVFQLSTLCCKIVCEKLNYKAREEEL